MVLVGVGRPVYLVIPVVWVQIVPGHEVYKREKVLSSHAPNSGHSCKSEERVSSVSGTTVTQCLWSDTLLNNTFFFIVVLIEKFKIRVTQIWCYMVDSHLFSNLAAFWCTRWKG